MYDVLNGQAEKIPAGSEGLVVLPYFMGERSPVWDSDAKGTIVGLFTYTYERPYLPRISGSSCLLPARRHGGNREMIWVNIS